MPCDEQRREVAVALRLGRHRELAGLGERSYSHSNGREEERPVAAIVELAEEDRPAAVKP